MYYAAQKRLHLLMRSSEQGSELEASATRRHKAEQEEEAAHVELVGALAR